MGESWCLRVYRVSIVPDSSPIFFPQLEEGMGITPQIVPGWIGLSRSQSSWA